MKSAWFRMGCLRALTFIALAFSMVSVAGEVNYRAQGHYYAAKSALERGNYADALGYVYKAKESLGGINREIQYLHVLSAYNAERYEEAMVEMEKYFQLREGKLEEVHFGYGVDQLTDDEVRSLTMLMNPIYEKVDRKKEDADLAKNLSGAWFLEGGGSRHHGSRNITITQSGDVLEGKSEDQFIGSSGKTYNRTSFRVNKIAETDTEIRYEGRFIFGYTFTNCDGEDVESNDYNDNDEKLVFKYDKIERKIMISFKTFYNPDCNATEKVHWGDGVWVDEKLFIKERRNYSLVRR